MENSTVDARTCLGVCPTQSKILALLSRDRRGLTYERLRSAMGHDITPGEMLSVLDELIDMRLIRVRTDVWLELTQAGRDDLEELNALGVTTEEGPRADSPGDRRIHRDR